MTGETRERIEQYEKALPNIKEKITAAVVLLVVAMTIMVTATYAWITLSASPEVTSIDTTVAANGALEIAMANGTGAAPGKSAAGDSTGAGTDVTEANTKWGNLVNLSDPSYGLARVTLRPASLNENSLLTNPLSGVSYGADGRIVQTISGDDFRFTYYDTKTSEFLVDEADNHLGVRAIASVTYRNAAGDNILTAKMDDCKAALKAAQDNYDVMPETKDSSGKTFISSLEGLMSVYAQSKADKSNVDNLEVTSYVQGLYEMMIYLNDKVMVKSGESYLHMANMLSLIDNGEETEYTVATLAEAAKAGTLPEYIKIKSLAGTVEEPIGFAEDYIKLQSYLKTSPTGDFNDMKQSERETSLAYWAYTANNGGTVLWKNIKGMANWLCDIQEVTLNGIRLGGLGLSTAMDLMNQKINAVIHEGAALYRLEQRIGFKMSEQVTVTVKYFGTNTLNATMTTAAAAPYQMDTDIEKVRNQSANSFVKGTDPVASDTYALAIDLWLRSNAGSPATVQTTTVTSEDGKTEMTTDPTRAYLTLEGRVRKQTIEEPIMLKDTNGNEWPSYTATYTINGEKKNNDVYLKSDSKYYIRDESQETNFGLYLKMLNNGELPSDLVYTARTISKTVIMGYDGVNRIWSEEQMLPYEGTGTSTTQGGGCCYTFYANPNTADEKRYLKLLESMFVAFIDSNGNLLGQARMDTENAYAENGKITVPLALMKTEKDKTIDLGLDENGNQMYSLMALTKNASTRITAIVYLTGKTLTNETVLASGDIQGNLNLQFGSYIATKVTTVTETTNEDGSTSTRTDVSYEKYDPNKAIENEEIMDDKIAVTASVTGTTEFEYDPEVPARTDIKVTVEGIEPNTVQARFIRAISSTQGVLQDPVTLTASGNDWVGEVTFDKPGNYVLRSVWVNGVEYDLNQEETVIVSVIGSTINSLTCDALPIGSNTAKIMTADMSFTTNLTLNFSTSKQTPSRVMGVFVDESGRQVNAPFALVGNTWVGKAIFSTSGTFVMKQIEIDGDVYALQESLQPTLVLSLGLKTRTTISASQDTINKLKEINEDALPTRFVYNDSILNGGVTLNVSTAILDNSGAPITGLTDVKVVYGRVGTMEKVDADVKWDIATQSYIGDFLINGAGTYRFEKVTVTQDSKTSTISASISAPDIQAMPPDDVSYFGNATASYQYSPEKDAIMAVDVAYSSAATKVTATLQKQLGGSVVVEGTPSITVKKDGKSVTTWSFAVPDSVQQPQEGEWTLNDVTLYGVYYEKEYYGDENGIRIDLKSEGISTKIVNTVYVVLSGDSQNFGGTFMTDHEVAMSVTIKDYEGEPIKQYNADKQLENVPISDVSVVYPLNLNDEKTALEKYGYTADNLGSVKVSGSGTLRDGTETVYDVTGMNFRQAGPYNSCTVRFFMQGKTVTAGAAGTVVKYTNSSGTPVETYPTFDVTWTTPDVKLFYIKQFYYKGSGCAKDTIKEFNQTQIAAGITANNKFYASEYKASVWWQRSGNDWYYPRVKLLITDMNAAYYADCTMIAVIPARSSPAPKKKEWPKTFTFNSRGQSVDIPLGKIEGDSGDRAESGSRGSGQYFGNFNMDTLIVTSEGVTFNLDIKNTLQFTTVARNDDDNGKTTW